MISKEELQQAKARIKNIRDAIFDAAKEDEWEPPDLMAACIAVIVSIARMPAPGDPPIGLPKLVEAVAATYKDASTTEKRRKEQAS